MQYSNLEDFGILLRMDKNIKLYHSKAHYQNSYELFHIKELKVNKTYTSLEMHNLEVKHLKLIFILIQ